MEAGPHGVAAAHRRGGEVPPEGGHHPRRRPTAACSPPRPFVVLMCTFLLYVVLPAGPDARRSATSTPASSSPWPCRRSRSSACSWPAGRRPTSTRSSAACGPPASSSPTSCRWCSPSSAWSSRPAPSTCRASSRPRPNGEIFGWGGLGNPYILTQFVGFLIFLIAVQAELTQAPFDMPVAESEIVGRLPGRVHRLPLPALLHRPSSPPPFVFAAIAAVLFLGGWWLPGFDADAEHPERPRARSSCSPRSCSSRSSSSGSASPTPASGRTSSRSSPGSSSSRCRCVNIAVTGVLKVVF